MRTRLRNFLSIVTSAPLGLKIAGIQIFPILLISLAVMYSIKSTMDFMVSAGNREVLVEYFQILVVNLFATMGIAIVISAIFAYLLSLVLVRPIRQVRSAIQKVEMGDFSARVSVWSLDEIGLMLKAFNDMLEELQETQSALIHRNWQLSSINELAESVTLGQGTDAVIESALKKVVTIMESDVGLIFLYRADNTDLKLKAVNGAVSPAMLKDVEHSASGKELLKKVVKSGHAMVISAEKSRSDLTTGDLGFIIREGYQSWACSPLKVEGEVIGVYLIGRHKDHPNIYYDTTLLEVVGNVFGVILSNAQLLKDLRSKESELRRALHRAVEVQEEERKRLARELHDEIGQALTSILIQLKLVQEGEDTRLISRRIDDLRQLTSHTIEELRRLAMDLRPAALDNLGIAAALRWYTRQCTERTDIEIEFSEPEYSDRLPSDIELILYRVAQEGLNNAIRHGKATRIQLGLEIDDSLIRLVIQDNGKGFQQNERFSGLGLVGIRERVELLQGHFTVNSLPGSGTHLLIEIPVPEKQVQR